MNGIAVAPENERETGNGREPLVRAEELRKSFGTGTRARVVLDGVNLQVERGEWIAIVGASGAGKSTLLQLLAALDTPSSGRVYFASHALHAMSEEQRAEFRRRSIGFVWQRHHLLADFSAAENVAAPLLLDGISRSEALRQAEELLDQVGLAGRAGQRAAELSGGERQRVAIARALVNRPELLLADEPTGELDEQNAEAVFRLMAQMHESRRLTTILATHNPVLARRTNQMLTLERGRLTPLKDGATGDRESSGKERG